MEKYIATFGDLFVLRFSGIAICRPETVEPGLPSWVPDLQAISLEHSWQPFPTQDSSSGYGLGPLRSSQARVLDQRYLRVNACICDTISDAGPIFDTDSLNFERLYRSFLERKSDIETRTRTPYMQAILCAILSYSILWIGKSSDASSLAAYQRLVLATLYFLEGLVSNAPVLDILHSTVEALDIAFENHVPSLLQTVFPHDMIYDCWKSEKWVATSIIGQARLLRPHLTRSLKERHHLFTTYTGYIGSSLYGVKAGDVIGVIQGCPFPVLLRVEGTRYIHLETCNVLGL
ncbi:ATPase family AAA domain-containing protein 1 [Paraphaeosphaeria sporulosa]